MINKITEFFRVIGELKYLVPSMNYKWPEDNDNASMAHSFLKQVNKNPDKTFILYEDETHSYKDIDDASNVIANYLDNNGIKHGDKVVLFMENRTEYITTLLAINKLGATSVLINYSLTGDPLIHCINSSNSKKCIFGNEQSEPLHEVLDSINIKNKKDILWVKENINQRCPEWATNIDEEVDNTDVQLPNTLDNVTAKDTAFYIFTSGTTGVPKAAIFPNVKLVAGSTNIAEAGYRMTSDDCLYNCLPLYHSTGLILGLCAVIHSGASTFIKRKFSASSFWLDAKKYNTTAFVYVGELCRYLSFQEPCDAEINNPIKAMVGNGLRPDIWDVFTDRFKVERIIEIYGASEANTMFLNLLNKPKTVGMTSGTVELIEYDIATDEILKDKNDQYIKVKDGEPGLLIVKVKENAEYHGYTDKEASEKKLIRNVFENGDAWFNSGDLLKTVDVGFSLGKKHYQFVDRIGDTFRWKSENVSTNEVGEILNKFDQVNMANVFGVEVPNCEGRAGMAAFNFDSIEKFNWDKFSKYVINALPKYAQPLFIRITGDLDTTGTFKLKKNDLRNESYHLDKIGNDHIYVLKNGSTSYEPLNHDFYQDIIQGNSGF